MKFMAVITYYQRLIFQIKIFMAFDLLIARLDFRPKHRKWTTSKVYWDWNFA